MKASGVMDKFNIDNVLQIAELSNELDLERATAWQLRLRWMSKEDESLKPVREHLRKLIKKYEREKWPDAESVTDKQVQESDKAEELVRVENKFIQERKERIRNKLKEYGLSQQDLAKILGHRANYMSELMNGIRPFSKEDIVVIHRLLKIKLEHLMPVFIRDETARHIKSTLLELKKPNLKLSINALGKKVA